MRRQHWNPPRDNISNGYGNGHGPCTGSEEGEEAEAGVQMT